MMNRHLRSPALEIFAMPSVASDPKNRLGLLTVREVAAFLRVLTRTVYELCEKGRLRHVRIANAIRVEPTALVALVRSRTE